MIFQLKYSNTLFVYEFKNFIYERNVCPSDKNEKRHVTIIVFCYGISLSFLQTVWFVSSFFHILFCLIQKSFKSVVRNVIHLYTDAV